MSNPHSIEGAITLEALNKIVGRLICADATQNVWITAELSDVAVRGGHCYLELLQKDSATGRQIAKARGIIWANNYPLIAGDFMAATGQQLTSGIKVMLQVSATFHPVFGMSLIINAINPDYTMGDLLRRRREILQRLEQEGILNDNRNLKWPPVPSKIAVISAPGAAGYGDFINQLFHNRYLLNFKVRLYPAIMQGEKAPASIVSALEQIFYDDAQWDGVVIIRGGGATSDLAAFEDYTLAASIAQFPLPVIIGIGHERDITVLDYVANMRVKTPTAAAEWLIAEGVNALARLQTIGLEITKTVSDRLAGHMQQLAYYEGLLPTLPVNVMQQNFQRLRLVASNIQAVALSRIASQKTLLANVPQTMAMTINNAISRQKEKLKSSQSLLDVLSPQSILNRGYSITKINGKAVTSVSDINVGTQITTILANGTLTSEVVNID